MLSKKSMAQETLDGRFLVPDIGQNSDATADGLTVDLVEVRLTDSRIFNSELYDRAAAKSWCLPAIILPSTLVPRVVRTSGAVVYKDEGTCIVRLRSDASAAFLTAPVCSDALCEREEIGASTWNEDPMGRAPARCNS